MFPPSGVDAQDGGEGRAPTRFYTLHQETRQVARLGPSDRAAAAAAADARTSDFATLLFENDRVRVSDFRLPPGGRTAVEIRHRHPTIRWQVDEGKHLLEVSPGKGGRAAAGEAIAAEIEAERAVVVVPDRRAFYVESGTTWTLSNAGDGAYRQIVFELLSETPKYNEEKVRELFARAKCSTDVGTALLFENHLCRVWDFYLEPGQGGGEDTVHHHCLDYVFINVSPSRLLGLHPESLSLDSLLFDSVSQDNDVTWNSIPEEAATDLTYAHGGKNGYDDRPMREYLVELK